MIYPEKISARLSVLERSKPLPGATARGVAASFRCGSFIRFFLAVDADSSVIREICFTSNGCGYMVAAADILAELLSGRELTDLRGLSDADLLFQIRLYVGAIEPGRYECIDSCLKSVHSALGDLRASRIEEFAGEKALICSCFGVTEERIETIIQSGNIDTVDDVSAECNAGRGCGSCRMMIEEMIDNA